MSKTYRPYDPEQQLLLPAALQPADHMAYFISDVVEELDLSVIMARYEGEERGGPPYHPRMLVKVLLYGYCIGVASSRRIARRLHEDIAFRALAANNMPDFRTIPFADHLPALADLFLQVLVSEGGSGEAGACGLGWDQGEGQRFQTQGDELWTHEGEGNAVGGGGGGVAGACPGSG